MSSSDSPIKSLTGKVALVTGAGRGIGHGIALELGKRGASVIVNYANSKEGSGKLVKEIESFGSKAIAIQADVSKTPEVKRLFKESIDHFGRLDVVCSNAGKEVFCPEQEVTEKLYDEVFALNARAQFFVAQQAFIHLSEGGRIILMSSVAATMSGVPNHALYAGSKAAVEGFTRSFSKDCGPRKITVNAIAPVSCNLRTS
jgi:3-oxoacyl-[acyl-carrier protein] reductase